MDILLPRKENSALARRLCVPGGVLSVENRQLLYGLLIVVLVAIVGMLLTLQGWKSRVPASDMLTYFNSAETLLKNGTPARFGDISSYGSFSPPGTTWLMAPGMLVLKDARLYEKLGSALLYLGTLLGVFLLARAVFGIRCAYLSVVLYGLSGLGLSFAGSLWPIGHPVFYVWMAYFAIQWVTHRDAKYLAAAIAIWTVGMYDDMAITPAVLALPALWLIYRPPLFSRLYLIAAVLTVAVWYPYLQFEMSRGFVDLRSQLLLHNIFPSNYKVSWCDPSLTLKYSTSTSAPSLSNVSALQKTPSSGLNMLGRVRRRGGRIVDGLLANFQETTPFHAISIPLLLLTLITLVMLGVNVILPQVRIGTWWISRAAATIQGVDQTKAASFVLTLAIPWLTLLLVAESGRPERFFWLWPLQAIALIAFVANVSTRLRVPAPLRWIGVVVLTVGVLLPSLQSHVGPWLRNSWAGSDPEEVQVVDYLSDQLRSDGKEHATIGYQIFIYEFMANYNILDRQYKVGADFDFLFKHRHGITNTDQCAEGLSPDDEYRIVETRPKGEEEWQPRQYFEVPLDKRFRLLRRFELYEVFKRN